MPFKFYLPHVHTRVESSKSRTIEKNLIMPYYPVVLRKADIFGIIGRNAQDWPS